jgi:hypothetical protein
VAFSGLKIISKLVIAIGVIRDKPPMAIWTTNYHLKG